MTATIGNCYLYHAQKGGRLNANFEVEFDTGLKVHECHLDDDEGKISLSYPRFNFNADGEICSYGELIEFSSRETRIQHERAALEALAQYIEEFAPARTDLLGAIKARLKKLDRQG